MIDRRALLFGFGAVMAAPRARAKAMVDTGLFWRVAASGKSECILFGYARTAASLAAKITSDGNQFVASCEKLVADVPNVSLPRVSTDLTASHPIYERIPADLAQRVRSLINQSLPKLPGSDRLTGLELTLLLQGEGQTSPQPSVGGVILEEAQKAGKTLSYLLTPQEYAAGYQKPDFAEVEKRVTAEVISYLLAVRDRVGPIGKYQETLYVARRVADLSAFGDDLKAHGVLSFADISGLPTQKLSQTIAERALSAVQAADAPTFFMLPVGTLTEMDGALAKIKTAKLKMTKLD